MIEEVLGKLILMEATVLLGLSYKTVVRKPLKRALDRAGETAYVLLLLVFIIASTFLISTLYTLVRIHLRSIHADSTDHLLFARKLLQASLIGFLLYLAMLIYKFHHLMRTRASLKKNLKVEEKQLKDRKRVIAVQAQKLKHEVARLKAGLKKLESEYMRKSSMAKAKEAVVSDLKKKSEVFNREYGRLLEYNQTLRNQLQSIDQTLLDKQESRWTGLKASIMRAGINLSPWRIQEPDKNGSEVCSDNIPVTTNRCYQLLLSGTSAPSLPRHRRPIYQHSY